MSEPVFMGVNVLVGMRESERECARFCLVSLPPHLHMCSSKVTLPLLTPLPWPPSPPRARACVLVSACRLGGLQNRYLISARWYNTWRSFADGLSQEPPGPIDNSALFGASTSCVHLQFVVGCF